MLIYKNENNLITTSLGNPYQNMELMSIRFEAKRFEGVDNRFFKILSTDSVPRGIRHISRESMNEEAIRRFTKITGEYDSCEAYDDEKNIGYKIYPFMRKKPTMYSYQMLHPIITNFFKCWHNSFKNGQDVPGATPFDLSSLFASMQNFENVQEISSLEDQEQIKKSLYQYYPEFAIFCYEIYPYLNIETIGEYNITKLISARLQVYELGFETSQFDHLLENVGVAENNTKVLELIRKIN